MRIIKLGLLSIVFLIVVVTLISLLFPSHIRLSKATNVPNEPQRILALLHNDSLWHPAYQDTSSRKGFASIHQKVVEQTDSTFVVQLRQQGQKPVISGWQLYGTPASDSLTLQWYMDFQLGWLPWKKFSSLFYERTFGTMMENGLANVKQQLTR